MCFRPNIAVKPVVCFECNTANPPNSTVCKKCGAELKPTEE